MPLVPLDRIKRWYKTDSIVYRNFAYLFKNPLWTRNVPQGMAVCPYWWSSVFCLLVFRPLFVPTALFLRWIIRVLNLTDWIRWTDRQCARAHGLTNKPIGMSTIILMGMVGLVCGATGCVSYLVYMGYTALSKAQETVFFFTTIILVIGMPMNMIFNNNHAKRGLTIVAAILLSYFLINSIFCPYWGYYFLLSIWHGIWWVISGIGSIIYLTFSFIGYSIWNSGEFFVLNWVFSLALLVMIGISTLICWRVGVQERIRSPYMNYRLKHVRRAVLKVTASHIAGNDKALYERVMDSDAAYNIICQIVDSFHWLTIDLDRIGMSVSARVDAVVAAIEKVTHSVVARAIGRGILKVGRGIKAAGSHSLTLGCMIWELIKAKKSQSCPWLPFEGNEVVPLDVPIQAAPNQTTHTVIVHLNGTV